MTSRGCCWLGAAGFRKRRVGDASGCILSVEDDEIGPISVFSGIIKIATAITHSIFKLGQIILRRLLKLAVLLDHKIQDFVYTPPPIGKVALEVEHGRHRRIIVPCSPTADAFKIETITDAQNVVVGVVP